MSGVIELSDESFDSFVAESDRVWLVDFFADWCGPCHALDPILDELASERAELRIGRLDVSDNPIARERFSIQTLPTLVIFEHGLAKARLFGAATKRRIARTIDDAIEHE